MYRKFLFSVLFTSALLIAGSAAAVAQTSPVRGEVKLKKADGDGPFEGGDRCLPTDVGKGSGASNTPIKRQLALPDFTGRSRRLRSALPSGRRSPDEVKAAGT